jgi:hypothetical protein
MPNRSGFSFTACAQINTERYDDVRSVFRKVARLIKPNFCFRGEG